MADKDARRGHSGAELASGDSQVIDAQAERGAGRLLTGVTSAGKVQAEHGHA